ncbi:mannose-specific lectin [Cryptomeria japonica]|uniref:mannose-specific lectin n=1 Tax=Cryptomeria japonica TaxID=3369 RepID=UPI0027DAAC78|nr:mannose-specific lectin [Cryptomeria japonica]
MNIMGSFSVTRAAIMGMSLLVVITFVNPCSAKSILRSGQSLSPGQSLEYAQYIFVMQRDCNLVLYENNVKKLWESGTTGKGGAVTCALRMQRDGNLAIYAATTPVWSSQTSRGFASYFLQLQGDGNVVIYGPSGAIWATDTAQNKKKLL